MNLPTTFEGRFPLWVAASHKLAQGDPWIAVDLQQLGMTEQLILKFEAQVLDLEQERLGGAEPMLITAASSHSRLWVLGFYEVLRTYRQRVGKDSPQFSPLFEVFRHLELARMPLAKHEPKGRPGEFFYPQTILKRDVGWLGWQVVDPKTGRALEVFRTALANEFLSTVGRPTAQAV
jgi:hypothetical protein